jgi:uncharacterized protein (TIGR01777 family)
MRVVVTGATGFIGSALVPFLASGGHAVTRLVRPGRARPSGLGAVRDALWDPGAGALDRTALDGADAVIHLAGEGIAEARWGAEKKARIRASRVGSTRLLAETLATVERPPRVLVSASAIGVYGDRGDERLTEAAEPGRGFLAEVGRDWEAAAEPARRRGLRVVHPRIGMVAWPTGGALAKLLPVFRVGGGGKVGSGRQWVSWIALDDLLDVLLALAQDDRYSGAVNAVAPRPLTNADFTRVLAGVLGRPAALGVPAFAARLAFGEIADEVLLASQRVVPAKLEAAGHPFRHPDLEGALRHMLGKAA